MNLLENEEKLLKLVTTELLEMLETEGDALELRQQAFQKVMPNGQVVQVQISVYTDVEDFLEGFTTVINHKYQHPSV